MEPLRRPRRAPLAALLAALAAVTVAACAPATDEAVGAELRPFQLAPIASGPRYLVAVYDVETDPTRVDVSLLPARERDTRLFTELGSGIGNAPPARRADQLAPRGVRLRYVSCPVAASKRNWKIALASHTCGTKA